MTTQIFDLLFFFRVYFCVLGVLWSALVIFQGINRIYDGVEAETRKSQASLQIIQSYVRLAEHKT